MKIVLYYFQFLIIRIIFFILKILPLNFSKKLSSTIFRIVGKLTSADKTAINNCKFVFPNLEHNKIREIIDKSWDNIGKTICELLRFEEMLNKNNIIIKGLNNIKNLKNNNQAIFISIHQSNWEVLVPMLERIGLNIGGIYRHINNFFLDKLVLKIRKKSLISNNNFYTPKGKKSAKDLVEAINNKFSIVLLVDQKDSAGEDVLFFNKNVKTQIGFLKIARKFNLPIIPIKNTRLENGKIELTFLKPIFHNNEQVDDSKMMEKIHKIIENWVISNPQQWFWQHKRFN